MVLTPTAAGLLCSKIVESFDGRRVSTLSRSSCFGRLAVSFHFAAADSTRIALIAWNSLDATTARKLPSRTILTHAGHLLDRRRIAFGQLRAVARRPHHAGMHHAGQPHVLHIGSAAGDLVRDIDARHRLAHHLERRGILQLRFRLRLHMQHVARHQFAVAEPPCRRRRSPRRLRCANFLPAHRAAGRLRRPATPAPAPPRSGSRCRCPGSNGCRTCSLHWRCGRYRP